MAPSRAIARSEELRQWQKRRGLSAKAGLSTRKGQRDLERGPSLSETVAQGLKQKGAPYEDYLRLLQDDDLWTLMGIPFSPEMAEFTRQAGQRMVASTEPSPRPAAQQVRASTTMTPDETVIREAIARQLDKPPSELSESDYARVTKLDLRLANVSDLTPLQGLTNLQLLTLDETQVSDAQIAKLKEALPQLNVIGR